MCICTLTCHIKCPVTACWLKLSVKCVQKLSENSKDSYDYSAVHSTTSGRVNAHTRLDAYLDCTVSRFLCRHLHVRHQLALILYVDAWQARRATTRRRAVTRSSSLLSSPTRAPRRTWAPRSRTWVPKSRSSHSSLSSLPRRWTRYVLL